MNCTVVFRAELDNGEQGIFLATESTIDTVVDSSGVFETFSDPAINNGGTVVFAAALDDGSEGIFVGDDPVTDKVVLTGDSLFNSTVFLVNSGIRSLNDRGQILFHARLNNGVAHLVITNPKQEVRPVSEVYANDPAFNADGLVQTRFNGGETARAAAIQNINGDEKIIVAGEALTLPNLHNEFAVVRYNSDGTVDTTFGTHGLATGGFDSKFGARDLAIQPDGKIVAVGSATVGNQLDVAIARYDTRGRLDSTFGNGGLVTTGFTNGDEHGSDVIVQNGKLLITAQGPAGAGKDFLLARYDLDFFLDDTFTLQGARVAIDFNGGIDTSYALAAQSSDEQVVVVGRSRSRSALARLSRQQIAVPGGADLEIQLIASANPVSVGDDLTYSITVVNHGPDEATAVAVHTTLHHQLDFVASSPGCVGVRDIMCTIGGVPAGSNVTVDVTVRPLAEGRFVTSSFATADQPDLESQNDLGTNISQVGSVEDIDRDGVLSSMDQAAPNNGDGNDNGNDNGIPDSEELNVASLPNAVDGSYVTIVAPDGSELVDVQAVLNTSPANAPHGVSFPFGFFDFAIAGLQAGAAVEIEILLHGRDVPTAYYMYGPTPGTPFPHWYDFSFDGTTGAEFFPDRIVLHKVDGSRGDSGYAAGPDGQIIDPGAPAAALPVTAEFVPVQPETRYQNVDVVTLVFSDAVEGFDLSDLILTRDDEQVALGQVASLASDDNRVWRILGLNSLTDQPGAYRMTLDATGSGIYGSTDIRLVDRAFAQWTDICEAGDANLDGQFDIVAVLQATKYRTVQPAAWSDGDWNSDGRFDQFDIIHALHAGNYRQGPYV